MSFKEITAREIDGNIIKMIADEWMLVAAGDETAHNMMTASWGGLGEMWARGVATTVIRPQRYTREFMDKHDIFTLSFYGDDKKIHSVCGKESGRDVDKTAKTGLTPVFEDGAVWFEQARLVIVCKKIFTQRMSPDGIIDEKIKDFYPENDHHILYVGEILKVLVK